MRTSLALHPRPPPPSSLDPEKHFPRSEWSEALLASWLVSDSRDAEIVAKEATRELVKLVRSRLGLDLPEDAALAKLRAVTLRYVLAGEFRSDLNCPPPACLDGVAVFKTKEEESAVRDLAPASLRASFADLYATLADSRRGRTRASERECAGERVWASIEHLPLRGTRTPRSLR